MTPYLTIYEIFAQKIKDFDLIAMDDDDVKAMMKGWLRSSIAKFRKCKNDLSQRDDANDTFLVTLLDIEIEILAILMVGEWLQPQMNSVLYTSQFIGGKEEKFVGQDKQLTALRELEKKNTITAKNLMRDYGYQVVFLGSVEVQT